MANILFRQAERKDVDLIFEFVVALATYENLENELTVTPELLEDWIFDKDRAEVIFAVEDGKEVGFAFYFYNFSTVLGRPGLYLEDLFVLPEYRGHGHGKALLKKLAKTAVEKNCGRFEWVCLDWNKSSIDFYLSLGAKPLDEWTTYRVTGDNLLELAK